MTHDPDQPEDGSDVIAVTFNCLRKNYEKAYSAAARNGESITDVINRGIAFYEVVHTLKSGQTMTWKDGDLVERKIRLIQTSYQIWTGEKRYNVLSGLYHYWNRRHCERIGHRPVVAEGKGFSVCSHCQRIMRTAP